MSEYAIPPRQSKDNRMKTITEEFFRDTCHDFILMADRAYDDDDYTNVIRDLARNLNLNIEWEPTNASKLEGIVKEFSTVPGWESKLIATELDKRGVKAPEDA